MEDRFNRSVRYLEAVVACSRAMDASGKGRFPNAFDASTALAMVFELPKVATLDDIMNYRASLKGGKQ